MVLVSLVIWSARANPLSETRIFARNPLPAPAVASQPVAPLPALIPGQPAALPESTLAILTAPATSLPIAPEPVPDAPQAIKPDHAGMLNTHRDFALGMIESGNNDRAVGGLGEVSRYQIMPSVWKHYSDSRSYRDQGAALEVASQHWTWLHEYFEARARRDATDFDMYVLWNTRHGYYAGKGFNPNRLHPVIRDRAERFANLVERGAD